MTEQRDAAKRQVSLVFLSHLFGAYARLESFLSHMFGAYARLKSFSF